MDGNILQLFDQKAMTKELVDDSIGLIHSTHALVAIRRLVTIADILELSIDIHQKYRGIDLVWDVSAIQDLANHRRYLFMNHRLDFKPILIFDAYDGKLMNFVRLIALQHPSLYHKL